MEEPSWDPSVSPHHHHSPAPSLAKGHQLLLSHAGLFIAGMIWGFQAAGSLGEYSEHTQSPGKGTRMLRGAQSPQTRQDQSTPQSPAAPTAPLFVSLLNHPAKNPKKSKIQPSGSGTWQPAPAHRKQYSTKRFLTHFLINIYFCLEDVGGTKPGCIFQ